MKTLRSIWIVPVLLVVALIGACGTRKATTTRLGDGPDRAAVWQIDEDANLAYPTCWSCGADVDRGPCACAECGALVHTEAKSIACPECSGDKKCAHCAKGRKCLACDGDKLCAICEGTGNWHGEGCPECGGAKACVACAAGSAEACERCAGGGVCANCDGIGEIVLK
jgi:hypothetical protein